MRCRTYLDLETGIELGCNLSAVFSSLAVQAYVVRVHNHPDTLGG